MTDGGSPEQKNSVKILLSIVATSVGPTWGRDPPQFDATLNRKTKAGTEVFSPSAKDPFAKVKKGRERERDSK